MELRWFLNRSALILLMSVTFHHYPTTMHYRMQGMRQTRAAGDIYVIRSPFLN